MIEQVVERQPPPPEQGCRSEAALVRVLDAEGAVEGSPEDVTEPLGRAPLRDGMFPRDGGVIPELAGHERRLTYCGRREPWVAGVGLAAGSVTRDRCRRRASGRSFRG